MWVYSGSVSARGTCACMCVCVGCWHGVLGVRNHGYGCVLDVLLNRGDVHEHVCVYWSVCGHNGSDVIVGTVSGRMRMRICVCIGVFECLWK